MEEHGDEKKRAMYGMGGVQAMCDGGKRSVFALRVVLTHSWNSFETNRFFLSLVKEPHVREEMTSLPRLHTARDDDVRHIFIRARINTFHSCNYNICHPHNFPKITNPTDK